MDEKSKNELLKQELIDLMPDDATYFYQILRKHKFSDKELKEYIKKFKEKKK